MFMVVPAQHLHWSLSITFVKHFGLQTPNRAVQLKMIWDCADQGLSIQQNDEVVGHLEESVFFSSHSCRSFDVSEILPKKNLKYVQTLHKTKRYSPNHLMKHFGIWLFWTGPSIHAAGAMHLLTSAIPSIIEVENESLGETHFPLLWYSWSSSLYPELFLSPEYWKGKHNHGVLYLIWLLICT